MRILLPPSEGKATPTRGRPLALDALVLSELTDARRTVLDALITASGRPDACALLGVPESLAGQVAANVDLLTKPTLPAGRLYTGVLYDALDLGSLDAAARRRAGRSILISSAAFGVLRTGDRVPAYRCSMATSLPGVGPLARHWSAALRDVLPGALGRHVVVDLRSSTYAAAWRPTGALAELTVAVRVLRDDGGRRTVVSHLAKHTRGLVARHLLDTAAEPRNAEELAEALATTFTVELDALRAGAARRIDVVEPAA